MDILAYSPNLALIESHVGIYKIYVLKHPDTDIVFYVGQTMQELTIRLAGHISETGANREKINFIKEIIQAGKKPKIEAIEVISTTCYIDKVLVNERELYWMKYYKESGCLLLNKTGIDGDGTHREYRGYMSTIKRGETSWHYYYCGKTIAGVKVYDERRMKLDGFSFPSPEPETKEEIERNGNLNNYNYNPNLYIRSLIKMGYPNPFQKRDCFVKTEIFPEQPCWTNEFKNGIDWSIGRPEWQDIPNYDEDLEPDCDLELNGDDEIEHDDNDDDSEWGWQAEAENRGIPFPVHPVDIFIKQSIELNKLI